MRNLFILTIALLGFVACESSTEVDASSVPAAVTTAFNAAYPGATDVRWEREDDHYEVEFDFNGEDMEVEYSSTGQVLEVDN